MGGVTRETGRTHNNTTREWEVREGGVKISTGQTHTHTPTENNTEGGVKEHSCEERLKTTNSLCLVINSACQKINRSHAHADDSRTHDSRTNTHTNTERATAQQRLIVEVVVAAPNIVVVL